MIYEYHLLKLQYNTVRSYYLTHIYYNLEAYDAISFESNDVIWIHVKTRNLLFKKHFKMYRILYPALEYSRQIQKYNYRAIKKIL